MKKIATVIWSMILFALIALIILPATPVFANRGHYPFVPNITVYQQGQKAIIGWNGNEEIMILSTDLYASKKTKILEFLPLPSKPSKIEKANTESFMIVQQIIENHAPSLVNEKGFKGGMQSGAKPEVKIVFHEKIGAHDITIVRANSTTEFIGWIKKFLQNAGVPYNTAWTDKLSPVIKEQLKEGIDHFVFDIIELEDKMKSIEPILYKFPTTYLYFPLKVSSLDEGRATIALYLLTYEKPDIWGTHTGFNCGHYIGPGLPRPVPIKFEISPDEISRISPLLGKLFNNKCWFSTAIFKGPVKLLERDFIIK